MVLRSLPLFFALCACKNKQNHSSYSNLDAFPWLKGCLNSSQSFIKWVVQLFVQHKYRSLNASPPIYCTGRI